MKRDRLAVDDILRRAKISDGSNLSSEGVLQMSSKEASDFIRDGSLKTGVEDYYCKGFIGRATSVDSDNTRKFLKINTTITNENELLKIMDEFVRKCFFREECHKVSILITVEDELLEKVILSLGFFQEALLRDEVVKEVDGRKTYKDAGMFSLRRSEYLNYNVCFVPFQRGVVAVTGGVDYVDGVFFLNYSSPIEDAYISDCAWYQGITDDDGVLLSRNDYPVEYDDVLSYLPAELVKAYQELKEFFHKDRFEFDITVKIHEGTPFQIQVWDKLKTIPYGVTCSYEDIALELTDNDINKARKLTRAVGKACSENPVPIIVPCHRVIGKNGMLVGFSGGIEFKDFLLQNELFSSALPLY